MSSFTQKIDQYNFSQKVWNVLFITLVLSMGILSSWQAVAQMSPLGMGSFSCTNGTANGNILSADTLVTTVDSGQTAAATTGGTPQQGCSNQNYGLFGRLLCFYKSTVGQILSNMYCGVQYAMQGPFKAVLTMFILVFGIGIATGIMQFTQKDAFVFLLKMVLVWIFATQAEWGIGVAYRFFMLVGEQGANMVLSALPNGQSVSLDQPDSMLLSLFNFNAGNTNTFSLGTTPSFPNLTGYCAKMLGLLALLLVFCLPIVIIFIIVMILMYLGLYARAMFGYLQALVLISFLFILSPLFISFALFRTTYPLFAQWLKFLTSFSLQIIVVFGFLVLLTMVPLSAFFASILKLIREYDISLGFWSMTWPIHLCSICTYAVSGNTIACTNTASQMAGQVMPPGAVKAAGGSSDMVIPLLNLFHEAPLIQYVVTQVIALWLIGYVMGDFLTKSTEFARQLGGSNVAPGIGGGTSPQAIKMIGMESIQAGFKNVTNQLWSGSNPGKTKIQSGAFKGAWNPFARVGWSDRFGGLGRTFMHGVLHGAPDANDPRAVEYETKMQSEERRHNKIGKQLNAATERSQQYLKELQEALAGSDPSALRGALSAYQRATDSVRSQKYKYEFEGLRIQQLRKNAPVTGLRGIMASSDGTYQGSIFEEMSGASSNEKLMELRQDRGGIQFKDPNQHNEYFMMKMPEDVPARDAVEKAAQLHASNTLANSLPHLISDAQSRVMSLGHQMAAAQRLLPPEQFAQLNSSYQSAANALTTADTTESVSSIIKSLDNLQTQLQ